nr:phospholipase D-like domain-containing protein [Halomarina salina]
MLVCCLTATVPPGAVALGASPGGQSAHHPSPTADRPAIVGLYPNPVADGDAGEFVVLSVPERANLSTVRVCDDEGCLRPERDASGRVVVTASPDRVRPLTNRPVVAADGDLSLANGGERLELSHGDESFSAVRYDDAPEAETYRRVSGRQSSGSGRWAWTPLGASDYAVTGIGPADVTAFTLPDAPEVVTDTLAGAEERLLLAGYTLTSSRVADELVAAHRRGVRVRVLVEGGPVGGIPRAEARLLDRLVRRGIPVRVVDGPYARYDYHHSKYAVVDDRAMVLTENWKPAGTGGHSSRGWGAVVGERRVADRLAATFDEDFAWRAARNWTAFRDGRSFQSATPANGTFPSRFAPASLTVDRVRLLVAPDNAESGVRSLLGNATDSVDVIQMGLGGPDGPFVRELLATARRGVEVRVLLSGAWYVREENRALADRLNALAERDDLPLTVRLADSNGAFEKVHAKGAVVDGEHVVVGSLNWNPHAARENREVAFVLSGDSVADHYAAVFAADWRGDGGAAGGERVPVGALAALVVGVLVALAVARRFEFER